MSTPTSTGRGVASLHDVFCSAMASYADRPDEHSARAAARAADELDQRHLPGWADEAHRWHTAALKLRRGERQ